MDNMSTTIRDISILVPEGGCSQRQLHSGIKYIPVASILSISLAFMKRRHS